MTTYQKGHVKPTGTRVQMWKGFFQRKDASGKWQSATKILGPKAAMSKQDAKVLLEKHIQGLYATTPRYDRNTTFAAAAERYIALKQADWGKQTQTTMACIFQKHIVPSIGSMRASEVNASDCKALFNATASSKSLLDKVITHTRAVFDMLLDDQIILRNPARGKTITLPKTPKPSGRYLTLDESRRLLAAAAGRDKLILRIMMSCGLRPSEVFALRLNDIEPGRLRIDEAFTSAEGLKDTKTDESDGYVPLSYALETAVQGYIAETFGEERLLTQFLFPNEDGGGMSPNNYLKRHVYLIAARAGLVDVDLRCLRRTTGTNMQHHGAVKSAQGLLRHADATTTMKHYQKTIPEDVVEAAGKWDSELMATNA